MPDLIDIDRLERYDKNLKGILKVWSKKTDYSLNDVVEYKGNYIECTTAGRSGTTTLNFTNVSIGDTITDGTVTWTVIKPPSTGSGLNDWKANTQYSIDDIIVNDGQIYKVLIDFTSSTTFENIQILDDYTLQGGETPIAWADGTSITTGDIVSYNSDYYEALTSFTCGSTFTKNVFEEYVPKSLTDAQIDAIVDNYNPVYSAATGVEYSTEERKVGTWIDGKPLYQITVEFTTPSANGFQEYSFLPSVPFSTMDKIISIDGWCARIDGLRVQYLFSHSQLFFYIDWHKTNQKIYFYVSTDNAVGTANQPATLTFRYTKTTD